MGKGQEGDKCAFQYESCGGLQGSGGSTGEGASAKALRPGVPAGRSPRGWEEA